MAAIHATTGFRLLKRGSHWSYRRRVLRIPAAAGILAASLEMNEPEVRQRPTRLQLWQPDRSVGGSIRAAVCAFNFHAGTELTRGFAPRRCRAEALE